MSLRNDLVLFDPKNEVGNPYEEYFLLRNPFPGEGETRFDVCSDQNDLKEEFVSILKNFSRETRRLRINGRTGAGKTNILKYFELLTNTARGAGLIENLHPIYVHRPGESYFDLHEQIVHELSALFLKDLFEKLRSNDSKAAQTHSNNALLEMMIAHTQSRTLPFAIEEERRQDIFVRWLKGQKLAVSDKKQLVPHGTPPSDITSAALAIRLLEEFLGLLSRHALCSGIVLLFDEFEEIFEGLPRSRQSRYSQDLRHLFDTLQESVFFVVATTPEPRDLGQYPAISRRLGKTMELLPLDDSVMATDYVLDYLNTGRDMYEVDRTASEHPPLQNRPKENDLSPLTRKDIEKVFNSLKEKTEEGGLDVLPGYFLPRIRERTREIVKGSS